MFVKLLKSKRGKPFETLVITIVLNLLEDIASELSTQDRDLSRTALESLALEGYRAGHLSEEQVRRMLGFESRFEVHAFLKQHSTHLDYTQADLEHDLAVARSLPELGELGRSKAGRS